MIILCWLEGLLVVSFVLLFTCFCWKVAGGDWQRFSNTVEEKAKWIFEKLKGEKSDARFAIGFKMSNVSFFYIGNDNTLACSGCLHSTAFGFLSLHWSTIMHDNSYVHKGRIINYYMTSIIRDCDKHFGIKFHNSCALLGSWKLISTPASTYFWILRPALWCYLIYW